MLWLSIFQEASLCTFKCDSSIQHFVIINYSGILSDPYSTKKPRGVLRNFGIPRKSYVFEKYFARLRKPLKVSKQLREDTLPKFFEKDCLYISLLQLTTEYVSCERCLAYSFFLCI